MVYDDTLTPFLEDLAERFRGWEGNLAACRRRRTLIHRAKFDSVGSVSIANRVGAAPSPLAR